MVGSTKKKTITEEATNDSISAFPLTIHLFKGREYKNSSSLSRNREESVDIDDEKTIIVKVVKKTKDINFAEIATEKFSLKNFILKRFKKILLKKK